MTTTPSSGSSGETPEQGSGSTSRYEAAVEQLHQTATWLIGIFAGIAALLIAGTQLSTIGHLRPDDIHLWLALAAGLLTLWAIRQIINAAVRVLTEGHLTRETLQQSVDHPKRNGCIVLKDRTLLGGYESAEALLAEYDAAITGQFTTLRAYMQIQQAYGVVQTGDANAMQALVRTTTASAPVQEVLRESVSGASKDVTLEALKALGAITRTEVQAAIQQMKYPGQILRQLQAAAYNDAVCRLFRGAVQTMFRWGFVAVLAMVVFIWAVNIPAPAQPAATAPTLPGRPVVATLALTAGGRAVLASALGPGCAARSTIPVVVLSTSSEECELVSQRTGKRQGNCRLARFTVSTMQGNVQAVGSATTPTP